MKITSVRIATDADAKAIAEIANAHELSIDSQSSLMSEQSALEFMSGYVDQSVTYLLSIDGEATSRLWLTCIQTLLDHAISRMFTPVRNSMI